MSNSSENLKLPYIIAAQAQKHVTHNEALGTLDALVQLSVASRALSAPPAAPAPGERHIVGPEPTGAWSGAAGQIAVFQEGAWRFHAPATGWLAYVTDEAALVVHRAGAGWGRPDLGGDVSRLGVNTVPDGVNRFAAASAASLFTHEGGSHRLSIDKATAGDTASLLFSDGFSAKAELGLAGDDQFRIKVSADGAAFTTAMEIDRTSGRVAFPAGLAAAPVGPNLLLNGAFGINQRAFAGGALAAGAYGYDRWKAGPGGAYVTRGGPRVTLASGSLIQVIEPEVFGRTDFAGVTLSVSVEDLSAGTLTVFAGSASGTLSPDPGTRSIVLALAAGDTGPLPFQISAALGVPAFTRLKLEAGPRATPFDNRLMPDELRLCQRYYETSVPVGQNPATYAPGAGFNSIYAAADGNAGSVTPVRYIVQKRAAPSIGIRDGVANAGRLSAFNGAWVNNIVFTGALGRTDKGFSLQQNNLGVVNIGFDYEASCEF